MPKSVRGMYHPLQWPSLAITTAPPEVKEAWDTYQAAVTAHQQAATAATEANKAANTAARDDEQAALEAARQDKPTPKPTVERKKEAAIKARLNAEARATLALEAEKHLQQVTADNMTAWTASIEPAALETLNAAATAIAAAQEAVGVALDHAAIYAWLIRANPDTNPDRGDRTATHGLAQAARDLVQKTPNALREAQTIAEHRQRLAEADAKNSIGGIQLPPNHPALAARNR